MLVHGHSGTRADLIWLAWRLSRRGHGALEAIAYRSFAGDLQDAARRLAAAVDSLARDNGCDRVDVVAYGAGGLVARATIRDHGSAARIRRLVTLATPHSGTRLAVFAPGATGRSLQPGSRLLTDLARDDPVPGMVSVTSIYSTFDAVVLPHRGGFYPGAANVEVDGVGHHALLFSPRIFALVREGLESD
jgi:pimeloyl-ACP methyl ester carboxylesterase